jgi:transposase
MPPRKKKTARRTAAKRKAPARTAAKKPAMSLESASASQQKKLFRALRQVMREFGVRGEVAAVHVTPAPTRAAAEAAAAAGCPPGQVSRVVCAKQPDGTVVCRLECQPV